MALTQTEKKILGHMVDTGFLRNGRREEVGSNDTLAREAIEEFKMSMNTILPIQIAGMEERKVAIDTELTEAQNLLDLLEVS